MPTNAEVWEDVAPLSSRYLSDEHREVLEVGSNILPEIIAGRGYYTLEQSQIVSLVHLEVVHPIIMRADSWMGIPIWRPDGVKHGEVIRVFGGDSSYKYIWPTGKRLALDVHPDYLHLCNDVEVPVLIGEGIKKGDAVLSASIREGIPLLVVSANGCHGWRNTIEVNGMKSKVASQDIYDISWEERKTYVCSDSDYRTNNDVSSGWNGCASYLSSKTGERRTFVVVTPPNGLDKQGADDFLASGKNLHDLLEQAQSPERAILDVSGERTPLKLKHGIKLIKDAGDKIPHMISPLIPERSITLVAGNSGTYKTWHTLGLAIDGAFGFPWLGHPGITNEYGAWTTIYVNKEMSGLILGQRLKTLMFNDRYNTVVDWEQTVEERLIFTEDSDLDLNSEEERQRLEDAIIMSDARMVILDSLSMCWHGDENSASEVGNLYAKLRGIIDRTGVCFVLLHHLVKPPQGSRKKKPEEMSFFSIRGSGQLYQQADACIMMDLYSTGSSLQTDEEKLVAMIHAKARTSVEIPAWVTKFSANDGMFTSMQYLCKLVEAKAQAYVESGSDGGKLEEWILEACATMPAMRAGTGSPGFRSKNLFLMLQQAWTVEDKPPPSDTTLRKYVSNLVDEGKIILVEASKKHGDLYKLAEPDEIEMEDVDDTDVPEV